MRRADLTIGIAAAVLAVIAVTPALGHDRKHDARPGHHSGHNDDHKPGHDNAHDNKVRAAKIEQLYQLLLKAPLVIAGQESVDHIFDASVEGRVTPVGEFHDREGVNEYFFGLAATPTSQVVAVDIKSLAASGNKVAVEVDITFAPPLLTLGFPPPQPPFPGQPASIPYGTWDRANSNTFVCRQLHSLLTPFRPDIHCPHCSPGGGGTCINVTYDSFFDVEF